MQLIRRYDRPQRAYNPGRFAKDRFDVDIKWLLTDSSNEELGFSMLSKGFPIDATAVEPTWDLVSAQWSSDAKREDYL